MGEPARDGVPVRDAATVLLLRDGPAGVQVWLLTRASRMAFAAGMAVFPGGRVDDADAGLPFVAGSDLATAKRFGCAPTQARALLGAAVRETFEETGVLLSSPPADLLDEREAVEAGRTDFGELLRSRGLQLNAARLVPWARWITPAGEVRRYDARFFVCGLPEGAQPADLTTESSAAGWFAPADAIERAHRGELGLMPPTLVNLAAVGACATVADVQAAAATRNLDPVRPRLRRRDDGPVIELPDGTIMPIPEALLR